MVYALASRASRTLEVCAHQPSGVTHVYPGPVMPPSRAARMNSPPAAVASRMTLTPDALSCFTTSLLPFSVAAELSVAE